MFGLFRAAGGKIGAGAAVGWHRMRSHHREAHAMAAASRVPQSQVGNPHAKSGTAATGMG